MTAKILWAFEIKHAVNAEGKEVALDPDNYIEGMVAQPAPFKVRVMPRSQNHAKVIRHAALNVEGLLKQWE
jgi:ribosomal protein L22